VYVNVQEWNVAIQLRLHGEMYFEMEVGEMVEEIIQFF
jgi:hypothetical protein